MSGRKRARPNYEQMYQQELRNRQRLARENRELERKNREQEVIRRQIAESESRVRRDLEDVQRAARRSAEELVRLHEQQQQAIEEITGVKVQLQVTQDSLQELRWETQQQYDDLAEGQQRIQQLVQHNREMIRQNREEIVSNRVAIDQGFKRVDDQFEGLQTRLDAMETREKLEKMRTAAQLIENIIWTNYNIPASDFNRFAPERYEQASAQLRHAQQAFASKEYGTAIELAQNAMTAMNDAANNTRERRREYETRREHALNEYNKLQRVIEGMQQQNDNESEFNDVHLWKPDEFADLLDRVEEVDELIQQEDFERVREQSEALYEEAVRLRTELDLALDRHTAREMLASTLTKSFTAFGPVKPGDIDFEDIDDPNSDVVIYTDGPEIHLPLTEQPEFRFELPQDPARNAKLMQEAGKVLQKQHIARKLNAREINY